MSFSSEINSASFSLPSITRTSVSAGGQSTSRAGALFAKLTTAKELRQSEVGEVANSGSHLDRRAVVNSTLGKMVRFSASQGDMSRGTVKVEEGSVSSSSLRGNQKALSSKIDGLTMRFNGMVANSSTSWSAMNDLYHEMLECDRDVRMSGNGRLQQLCIALLYKCESKLCAFTNSALARLCACRNCVKSLKEIVILSPYVSNASSDNLARREAIFSNLDKNEVVQFRAELDEFLTQTAEPESLALYREGVISSEELVFLSQELSLPYLAIDRQLKTIESRILKETMFSMIQTSLDDLTALSGGWTFLDQLKQFRVKCKDFPELVAKLSEYISDFESLELKQKSSDYPLMEREIREKFKNESFMDADKKIAKQRQSYERFSSITSSSRSSGFMSSPSPLDFDPNMRNGMASNRSSPSYENWF